MQDIHSIGSSGGGGARLFGASTGVAGDRRLRPYHQQHNHHQGHAPHALKCPRCESLNTKFCYYNNYNLSQPRHFCKNCRRYWTKGGVLRNVPVGGGCRKAKRSKKSSNNKASSESGVRKSTNSQNSSSDSSSLTASVTAMNNNNTAVTHTVAATVTTETATGTADVLSGNFQESCTTTTTGFLNPDFDNHHQPLLDHSPVVDNNIFPEISTFTSLISSSTSQLPLGFDVVGDISPFRMHHTSHIVENPESDQQQWMQSDDMKVQETGPTTRFMSDPSATNGDWNNGADQALFDLTGTMDQSYWNQTHWDDGNDHGHNHDHQLNYLP